MTGTPDFTRLPRGQAEWTALIAALGETDDRAERHFLEIKSAVDLNKETDRAKVAKFILGAANRSSDVAARYFDGYAVMFLGIAPYAVVGILPFEAMDLARTVVKHIGADGPSWDFKRFPVDADRDVIAVIVDPPSGDLWTCWRDGAEKLRDGGIYLRSEGESREAKGGEVRAMIRRARELQVTAEFDVSVVGAVARCHVSPKALDEYIDATARQLLGSYQRAMGTEFASRALTALWGADFSEPQTYDGYRRRIQLWADDVRRSLSRIVDHAAVTTGRGPSLLVQNHSDAFVEDVEVAVRIPDAVRALEGRAPEDFDLSSVLPEEPPEWGPLGPLVPPSVTRPVDVDLSSPSRPETGSVRLEPDGLTNLTLTLDSLRPDSAFTSKPGEFVLVTRDGALSEVSGRWRITARGHHRVYEGELTIPVVPCDCSDRVRALAASIG